MKTKPQTLLTAGLALALAFGVGACAGQEEALSGAAAPAVSQAGDPAPVDPSIQAPAAVPGVKEVPVTAQALRAVTADPDYQAALEILTADGWTVDAANGKLLTDAGGGPGEEIRFPLKIGAQKSGVCRGCRWRWLHYVTKPTDRQPKIYFVNGADATTTGADLGDAAGAAAETDAGTEAETGAPGTDGSGDAETLGLFCRQPGPWTPWTMVGTPYCAKRFWCFGNFQQGTYKDEERTRQCKNSVQRQTRTVFIGCGC